MSTDDNITQLPGIRPWRDTHDRDCAELHRLNTYFLKIQHSEYRNIIIKFCKAIYEFEQSEK
jgi:hypothetical protein